MGLKPHKSTAFKGPGSKYFFSSPLGVALVKFTKPKNINQKVIRWNVTFVSLTSYKLQQSCVSEIYGGKEPEHLLEKHAPVVKHQQKVEVNKETGIRKKGAVTKVEGTIVTPQSNTTKVAGNTTKVAGNTTQVAGNTTTSTKKP